MFSNLLKKERILSLHTMQSQTILTPIKKKVHLKQITSILYMKKQVYKSNENCKVSCTLILFPAVAVVCSNLQKADKENHCNSSQKIKWIGCQVYNQTEKNCKQDFYTPVYQNNHNFDLCPVQIAQGERNNSKNGSTKIFVDLVYVTSTKKIFLIEISIIIKIEKDFYAI